MLHLVLSWLLAGVAGGAAPADALDEQLGQLYTAGRYREAESVARESLALREVQGDPEALASALINLGAVLRAQGKVAEARPFYERSVAMVEALGPDHPMLATAMNNLGLLLWDDGDRAEARVALERALALREAQLDADDPLVAQTRTNLASLLGVMGHRLRALELNQAAVEALRPLADSEPMNLGGALTNVARTRMALGDHDGAAAACREALAVLEPALGRDHPRVGIVLRELGWARMYAGDYTGARAALERALEIVRSTAGADDPRTARTLFALADLSLSFGDGDVAQGFLDEASALVRRTRGPAHPELATILLSQAELARMRGEVDGGRALATRALEIRETALGPDDVGVAAALVAIANADWDRGNLEVAAVRLERAVAIQRRAGVNPQKLAVALHNLGMLRARAGGVDVARAYLEEALDLTLGSLGDEHPSAARVRASLAHVLDMEGRHDDAVRHRTLAAAAAEEATARVLDGLSEREGLAWVATQRKTLDPSLADLTPLEAWGAVLRWKGWVSRTAGARREAALMGDNAAAATLYEELTAVRRGLARATMSGTGEADVLLRRRDALERELAAVTSDFRSPPPAPREVCARFAAGDMVVEHLRYWRFDALHYAAFVVAPDTCTVTRVELGPASVLDARVEDWRAVVSNPGSSAERLDNRGARLYEALWAPVAALVAGARRIWIAPDGPLALVSFAALPVSRGGYLVEGPPLAVLETAWSAHRPSARTGVVAVGDVDYRQWEDPTCAPRSWSALPGTTREVATVADAARHRDRRERVEVLVGGAATESRVRAALSSARWVHLATHGWFAGDARCRSVLEEPGEAAGYDPMELSGVVLAASEGGGLLTAREVAELDLRGLEMVVMSACDTGLGSVPKLGEGIQGLRRAFQVAGAGTLLMSLWSVPDAATATLMDTFYARAMRRRRGRDPVGALREAQLAMLERSRAELGAGRARDWGAFVIADTPAP